MYKLYVSDPQVDPNPTHVINLETGWIIPLSVGNTKYQEYLEWLAQGNEPEPADE